MEEIWYQSKTAPTKYALLAGDGCHPDEADALQKYLECEYGVQEAAKKITEPILSEANPKESFYRLWALLCDALVELSDEECQKTIELLLAIQHLPSTEYFEWKELPGFGNMWHDLYQMHLDGPCTWEKENLTDERREELRRHFRRIGGVEAQLCLRGIGDIPLSWGFDVVNLVAQNRNGLDVLLSEVEVWLEVAGEELKGEVGKQSDEVRWYTRRVAQSAGGKQQSVGAALEEHWVVWKERLMEMMEDGSGLSDEGRKLAARCYDRM
ncbi:hypothetical protein CKM354_001193200 [Cercospora kikuchii]|uniref:Uncharacterized protein n=1 Tax=Cercospora kikuchii TaxID=84275 RepID=A0A9P3CTX1_9PEZI|nr:uncharacterized protein CKM354_001193200 [Cercospora kikuchii]GIZ48889.1 hypothetical protein CKM354_001193200 [Cercospora kikuchii]